jgi:hypothetical protein
VGNFSKSYWNITVGGGTFNGKYNITLTFGDNETYTISTPAANTLLAKYDGTWEVFSKYISGQTNWKTQLDWVNLQVKVDSLQTFSDFALTDASDPLPVMMSYFGASVNGRDAALRWITESEINNRGFEIQRRQRIAESCCHSREGGNPEFSDWMPVGFVAGHGTTTQQRIYDYSDRKLYSGNYQYRLKQIDYNGNSEYYELQNPSDVLIGIPSGYNVSQNYPNPGNPRTKIDYELPVDARVSMKVYDIAGREVVVLVDELKRAGYHTAEFDGSNLASGIYFYRLISGDSGQRFIKTMKMLLVK